MFIVLLTSIVHTSNHTKCVFLSNQKCEIRLTFINLHPNKYSQKFHYYPSVYKLELMTYLIKYAFQTKQKI